MRINVLTQINDFKGEVLKDKAGAVVTFREVATTAINAIEEKQTAEDKNKCYQIGLKLYSGNEVDFTTDQLALLKEKIAKIYNPLISGRAAEIIEGAEQKEEQSVEPQ